MSGQSRAGVFVAVFDLVACLASLRVLVILAAAAVA